MEALKDVFHSRIRNQISNVILFGSVVGLTAMGLVLGAMGGILIASRIPDLPPSLKLLSVILSTIGGFSAGMFSSLLVSPFTLRFAFFARDAGEWKGVRVFSAADEDIPGRLPNVFVAGFSFGRGPFSPVIFTSEGALKILSESALEAVFAHELSHLSCQHLLKRVQRGVLTFVGSSVLTAATLLGLTWSGYTEIGGIFSLLAGIIPAVLTWMTTRQMLWDQELEADATAISRFEVAPEALLEALTTLQRAIQRAVGGEAHPLVAERMEILRAALTPETSPSASARAAA